VGPHFSQATRKHVELADQISKDDCAIARHSITGVTILHGISLLMVSEKGVNLTFDKLRNLEPCGLDCLTGRPLGAIVNPPQNLHTIGVPLGGRHPQAAT